MSLDTKPLRDITEADLAALIANQVAEGKTIDYKRDRIGASDGEKKEFLYHVSSFANAAGGHLILGLDEVQGLPTALLGITDINPDQELIRLDQLARDGIRPAITGFQC